MIISNNIFLIRRFFRNLVHLDLKLVEGKRSGSWRTSTICVWPADGFLCKCIGWIGFWTVSHLWYCDILVVFILGWHATEDSKTSVHVFAGRAVKRLLESQHVLGINSQDIQRTPQGPYAEEKVSSQFDISLWMVLQKSNQKTIVFHSNSKTFSFKSPRLSMP